MNKNRTLVYCRESRDDYGFDYERIETQRDLLLRYCRDNNLKVVDVIMDDDETGTNFTRYEEVKTRVLNKEFDIILFKNSSRLGRNQKESLIFADFLEEHGIEIRFEDEKYDEESFGLFAWFNERRARDDSKNIRRNLREKIKQGKLIVKPIYGYDVVEKRLVVNENTAKVVRLIFDLYVNKAWGYSKIVKFLNIKGYKTPSEERSYRNTPKTNMWKIQNVKRIIEDVRYTGAYLGGTTEKVSFKSKKIRKKPREEWVIIPNMHEAIITKELWRKSQKINKERNKNIKTRVIDKGDNIFSGLLYCGKCGSLMYRRRVKKRKDRYLCKKYWREGKENIKGYGCISHNTSAEALDEGVKSLINKLFDNEKIKRYIVENIRCFNLDKSSLEKQLGKVNEQKKNIHIKLNRIYDDKLNNIIPDFLFDEKKEQLKKELKEVERNIENIMYKLNGLKSINNEKIICEVIEKIKQDGLTQEELKKLIKRITVFEPHEIQETYKEKYDLSVTTYNDILESGGVLFFCNW